MPLVRPVVSDDRRSVGGGFGREHRQRPLSLGADADRRSVGGGFGREHRLEPVGAQRVG
jgi:hypothetical protein